MTYVKKEFRQILYLADKNFTIPNCFYKYISKKEKSHNLIIKSKGNNCFCTNCQHKFINKNKINNYIKCPSCKQKLLIKSDRLQRYEFKDYLQLLDKVDNTFVLRTFELYSSYNNFSTSHIVTEFMRTIIKDNRGYDFVTNQVHNNMGYMYIAHYQKFENWRARNYRWSYRDIIGMICPYNLKKLLKDTELKYSQLDKFVAKVDYIDFIHYFNNIAKYKSFEMLVKLKLYNLAKDANQFVIGKTFKEIFGVPKTFYPFMKRYNLDLKELTVLRTLQKENISLIRKLKDYHNLADLARYVDLEVAYKKVLLKPGNYEHEYLDYLEACATLKYDMHDKKVLYPVNLEQEHNKVMKLLEIVYNEKSNELIKKRVTDLNKFIYKDKKYIVFPASSVESLIDESEQQHNCVKTYCKRYALGKCDIYYMRELSNIDKSLVTIEVRNQEVVQSRIIGNKFPTKEQQDFINKWQKKILFNM